MSLDFKKRDGSALIEAIAGLTMVLFAVGGIIGLVSQAISLNADISNRFTASGLATEGIELVKSYLDYNWNLVDSGTYELEYSCTSFSCATVSLNRFLKVDSNGMYQYGAGTTTQFKRNVEIVWDGVYTQVISTVSWTFKGEGRSIKIYDTFYNWRQ